MEELAKQIKKEARVNFYVHINGPDDLHPFSNEFEALKEANGINKLYLRERLKLGADMPLYVAVVKSKEDVDKEMSEI